MTKGKYKDLVDQETGEVTVVPIEYSPETYEFRSVKKSDYQKKWKENSTNQFTWSFQDSIRKMLSENKLTLTTLGAVLVLLPYLDNDSYLKKRTLEDKPLLTRRDLKEILKVSDTVLKRAIKSLKDCGVLEIEGSNKNQIFRINPLFHSRGGLPEDTVNVLRVQNRGIKALYDSSNIKLDTIGFLYLLIPYCSYESVMLTKDPAQIADSDNVLSISELAEELEMAERTVDKYIKTKFQYKFREGKYNVAVFMIVVNPSQKNKKMLAINPVIFRRNMKVTGELGLSDLDDYFRASAKRVK